MHWILSFAAHQANYLRDTIWWPQEHFERRNGPLVQLWEQTAVFRRETHGLFVSSSIIDDVDFPKSTGDTLKGHLAFSRGPTDMRLQPHSVVVGGTRVTRVPIEPGPQVVSLELRSPRAGVGTAWMRTGVVAPPTLASMKTGELAVSTPVLVDPPKSGEIPVNDPERATQRVLPTVVFNRIPRLGVYWETYGAAAGDTIDITIRIDRRIATGVADRVGQRLGITDRKDGGISVRWREPHPDRGVTTVPGRIPIQGRNVSLDISSLADGEYTVTISVSRPGGTPVLSTRDFYIMS
jgi:hypothetical protein